MRIVCHHPCGPPGTNNRIFGSSSCHIQAAAEQPPGKFPTSSHLCKFKAVVSQTTASNQIKLKLYFSLGTVRSCAFVVAASGSFVRLDSSSVIGIPGRSPTKTSASSNSCSAFALKRLHKSSYDLQEAPAANSSVSLNE